MKGLAAALLTLFCTPALWCQEVPRAEIFGGYSYVNFDTNGLTTSRQSANGWETSVSGNFNRLFALEGDVSGYYKTYSDVNVHDFAFVGGPRINFRPFFVHALVGFDHLGADQNLGSQNSFAGAFGGGVQWKVASRWAVRASSDYVLTRHNILGGPAFTQNNFRVSAGIVFFLGGIGETSGRVRENGPLVSTTKSNRLEGCDAVSQTPILGVSGCANGTGLRVTSIRADSPAARAGINPGDIVVKIDGRPVQSGRDIELAIAASSTGTITVGYLIKGTWLTERQVTVR